MRVLIAGCGYTGALVGELLARQGHTVWGARRADPGAWRAEGVEAVSVDITKPDQFSRLPSPVDWVVNTVSSSGGTAGDYRRVYLEGTRNLVEWLAPRGVKKFVYTSSTSVYGQADGSQVKESSPTEPAAETGRALVETESVLLDAFRERMFPAIVLRASGIYGPNRGHLFRQFLQGEARIEGKGERIVNMIHVEDLAGVIVAALKSGRPGEVYNATDDEPVAQIHFFRWLSETLGKWMPAFSTEAPDLAKKRGFSHKRVLNRKLKMELGYSFKFPTFRQGYTAEIQRLEKAGLLDIKPEAR